MGAATAEYFTDLSALRRMRQCRPPQDLEMRHLLRSKSEELAAHVCK